MAPLKALRLLVGLLALTGLGAAAPAWAEPAEPAYSVYVTPQLAPEVMHRAWAPLLEAISQATGMQLTLTIPPSITAFESQLLLGTPDFAFVNPYMMLPARKKHGYLPLLRNGRTALIGHLLVRKDSPATTLRDLDGATIAFPSPNAFGAALYIRALLARENIRFTPVYVGTHSNVFRHVLFGQAAAGGAVNITLEREPDDVKGMLRPIYSTPPLVAHAFAAHPRVAPAARDAVAAAILRLAARPEYRPLFEQSQLPEPVPADYARDYAPLESLRLERFLVTGSD